MEWQKLQERWKVALHGLPHFVLIAGEAGIGKTRLAEELLNWATHQGFCTVRSRCYAAEGRLTYAPVIECLRSAQLRQHRNKLTTHWLTELSRLLPEILSENPNKPAPEPITQSAQRHHLFEAATRALLAGEQPLILLIDDLQWCDKETLELLHFLLRNAPNLSQAKLLLVGTARLPDEVDTNHPLYELVNPLKASDSLTQLDLKRLTQAETSNLANQMAASTLDPQSLTQLFADTAGNPLFVVETMRASPLLASPDGGGIVAPLIGNGEEILQQLPPKVLAVIQSRLAQLSVDAQELCQWAAIIGRSFTLDLLISASKMAQDKAVNALDELWQRRILREQGSDEYDFSHDRIRDVAAAGVSRVRTRYLHRCVAEALENIYSEQLDIVAAQIAVHFDIAGTVDKAIDYYEQSAHHTYKVYAHNETIAHLQRAIQILKTLPENRERNSRELSLLYAVTPAIVQVTGFTTVNLYESIERTYELSKQLDIPLNPIQIRTLAIYKLGIKTYNQVQEMGEGLLELAKQTRPIPDTVLLVEGWYVLGVNAYWHGSYTQSRYALQRAIDNYSSDFHKCHVDEYSLDTGVYCIMRLGLTLWYLGFPDQARKQCELALNLVQHLSHPTTTKIVLVFSIWLNCECRNLDRSEELIRLLDIQIAAESFELTQTYHFLHGWYLRECGRLQASIEKLSDYVIVRGALRADSVYRAHTFALLAETYRLAGYYQQAWSALTEGFVFHDGSEDSWYIAEFFRIKGDLLIAQDYQFTEAESCFQQALEISRRQQAKSLELRTAMSMARLWDSQGKRFEARELLAGVYNWFTEGFDTADLQEAKKLLEKLS